MTIIYRQIEVVVAVQTSEYTANRTIHEEASFPSPDHTKEWQVDYVSMQILASSGSSNFTVMFYRGSTGLGINDSTFPSSIVDSGGLRTDGLIRLSSSDSVTSSSASRRVLAVSPPRRVSISLDNGVYKFQTFTAVGITLTDDTVKFVIGLVSGG